MPLFVVEIESMLAVSENTASVGVEDNSVAITGVLEAFLDTVERQNFVVF